MLSGGGIKALATCSALKCLNDNSCLDNINVYAGTSAGAVVAFLLVIGYKPEDIFHLITQIGISEMKNIRIENFLTKFGIDDASEIELIIEKLCIAKNISKECTFQELFDRTQKKLFVNACCINDKTLHFFSVDHSPNFSVFKAVRMSMALPIYFTPIQIDDKIFIDGGCIDNFPIKLFHDQLEDVIGVFITETYNTLHKITNVFEFIISCMYTVLTGMATNNLVFYKDYVVNIVVPAISLFDESYSSELHDNLYKAGYDAAWEKLFN